MDEKTRKTLESLHNLYKRPGTDGEKAAAKAAIERINKRLPKHEQLDLNPKSFEEYSDDDLFDALFDDKDSTLSDGSSIFKTKEEMRNRWAKMAKDSKQRAANDKTKEFNIKPKKR